MHNVISELVLGDVTVIGHQDKIEVYINRGEGLTDSQFFPRLNGIQMGILTTMSVNGKAHVLEVSHPCGNPALYRKVQFDCGEQFNPDEVKMNACLSKLLEIMFGPMNQGFGVYGQSHNGMASGFGQPSSMYQNNPNASGNWS